ncbi:hypothetical protein GCK72_004147 [Caenorhabditis remanei]|uniref:Uncharacterized protein n=1 Tax=Caenorhabditis remanei TaxID=31234 RepID=A0A6A5H8N4_CAERE|nr:hypothetical protein GCK72_004147 [Caenorhabditis remanei]KAF1764200.1 hypothetical protein GCK72_004147 [Caenorhabditis remanei]
MNRSPPLSYESLKSVLGQIDANTRFRLFSRIPSIRPTDKVVPLRIQKFSADNNKFKINDTEYEVGIYKKYPPGMTPSRVQEVNNAGGLGSDLDQHGFVDDSGKNVLTPGDVDLRDGRLLVLLGEPYQQQDERIPDLENNLEKLRRKIEFVESFGPIPEVLRKTTSYNVFMFRNLIEGFMNGIGQATTEHFAEFEEARKMTHDQLSREIKNLMAKLQPFYSRRDGVPVPYETFLQLTVTSPRQKHIEQIRYTKKLHEAAKYLSIRLFGNRRHPVHIKLLNLCWNRIMRLPVGLRLKIEEIERGMNIHLLQRSLGPLLDAPLMRLNTIVNNDEDFECSILKEARYLEVFEYQPYQIRPPVLLNLQNLNFHKISRIENNWSVEDFLLVIKNWVESGKKVGSCYSFGTSELVKNTILGTITEEYKDAETGDAFISIPSRFNNQVKVSIEEHQGLNRWVVKFEVLSIERATQ